MSGVQQNFSDDDSDGPDKHAAASVSVGCRSFGFAAYSIKRICAGCTGLCGLQSTVNALCSICLAGNPDWRSALCRGTAIPQDYTVDDGQMPTKSGSVCSSKGAVSIKVT